MTMFLTESAYDIPPCFSNAVSGDQHTFAKICKRRYTRTKMRMWQEDG